MRDAGRAAWLLPYWRPFTEQCRPLARHAMRNGCADLALSHMYQVIVHLW
jgi:hypothetical protein